MVAENNFDWSQLNMNVYQRPDSVVHLSEVLDRNELAALYRKFRRLQLMRNAVGIWTHPMRAVMVRQIWPIANEYLARICRPTA